MEESDVLDLVKRLAQKLPKFPDSRIDYSNAGLAPVITIFVRHGEKILLIKRSKKVHTYKEKWSTVTGYIDEIKPIEELVFSELRKEVAIWDEDIRSVHMGGIFEFTDGKHRWVVCTAIVDINTDRVHLDWEHTEHKWISPEELITFDTVPMLRTSYEHALQ